MNNIFKFNDVINYIEDNLTREVKIDKMAQMTSLSVYEFRRVFSFIVGVPIGEYIRNRRLSVAAEEILNKGTNVTDLALKYGYDSSSSFTRAFKSFHKLSPTEVLKGNKKIKIYTKVGFDFCINSATELEYKVMQDQSFYVVGHTENSEIEDSECCEKVWNNFYNTSYASEQNPSQKLYATYFNENDNVRCTIGQRIEQKSKRAEFVPQSLWACFTLKGTEEAYVNGFYNNILYKFFNSSSYKRADVKIPNVEIFPVDMQSDDFEWEIRVPIVQKQDEEIK